VKRVATDSLARTGKRIKVSSIYDDEEDKIAEVPIADVPPMDSINVEAILNYTPMLLDAQDLARQNVKELDSLITTAETSLMNAVKTSIAGLRQRQTAMKASIKNVAVIREQLVNDLNEKGYTREADLVQGSIEKWVERKKAGDGNEA